MNEKLDGALNPMRRSIGLAFLVFGLVAIGFAIVRYNSIVSQFMMAAGEIDVQLMVSAAMGVPLTILGLLMFTGLDAPLLGLVGPAKNCSIFFIVFGLLTIVGGVMGYVKAGSTASLIAGSISGILLLVAAFLLPGHLAIGLALGAVVSILLAGRFVPAFMRTHQVMPAGLMSVLSVIGLIMAIVAWVKK